jgi:glutaredoxin
MTATITVYGADWCKDTQRALRHLRRLRVRHQYWNIDEELEALSAAKALTGGQRRTPVIDLGLGGAPLVEPDNELLTAAVVETAMLTREDARERMGVQNVGDLERVARSVAGTAMLAGAWSVPRAMRWPFALFGAIVAFSGVAGWCPIYHQAGVTSLGGPGDRPEEADRTAWLDTRSLNEPTSVPEV